MRRFASAAVFAVAISAPAVGGAMVDHSVASLLGEPCSGTCSVGGAGQGGQSSGGRAQGGRETDMRPDLSASVSGTFAVSSGQTTGHETETAGPDSGTLSGNFNTFPSSKGHCTGFFSINCS